MPTPDETPDETPTPEPEPDAAEAPKYTTGPLGVQPGGHRSCGWRRVL
jgi:hypothetical protein